MDVSRTNPGKVLEVTVAKERRGGPITTDPLELKIRYPRVPRKGRIRTDEAIADVFRQVVLELPQEEFWVLVLDEKRRPLGTFMAHRGGLAASIVDPRIVFRPAVLLGAPFVAVCHNHPSGDTTPSWQDVDITDQLVMAGHALGIEVLAHVVIAGGTGEHQFIAMPRTRGRR